MVERKKPMPIQDLVDENIVDIFVGGLHNLALSKDGKLYSWGCNDQKALGRAGDEYEPAPVEGLEDVKIVKVACGDSVTVALSDEGHVYTCGTYRSAEGILGFAKGQEVQATLTLLEPLVKAKVKVVDVSAGVDHVLALTSTGDVYGWGNGQQNQLGRRIIERRKINGLRPEKLGLKNIVKIGTGSYHSFAIDQDGRVYAWGLNNFHQCGLEPEDGGNEEIVPAPTLIEAFEDIKIKQIIGGEHHSLALTEAGEVYGFGRSDSSQLGLPANLAAQDEDGNEASHKKAVGTPTKIPDLPAIKFIACGSNHNLALTTDGNVYSWGFGESLALGNGVEEDVETPIKVEGQKIADVRILAIGAGGQHSVLLGAANK
ncbi:RCC1/BLIP-II protein [Basidiobolus meristosporus CBS 931.73]|uniref:RCC1/BLIP-II protein n=1 Tax=Basidiobolus meristosporus CBS 931.73 TaxID=1314790 RepID=A0A1Y1ZCU7_9FUNG|nr:RCC1/BLIP-II protein [Basidiobolus meristosporus CBS 931.73]|eukprot:ORY08112.1 RCC1/BLIP-II protein [Basidiobolus meristosporus CBS 931.73]